ncbi:GlsB/YeaQ/YmgE family stress response membrane protein, partial [Streptomyces diastaticus]|uniref:GlsB/YeaQ/YmgE family stress response membrane protein n=1 Tax=Streptomyces diastaticus TaxID=1956 RepID=UPI00364E5E3A
MGIISWIILGLLAGAIAKIILPGRDPGGFIGTILIGIAGAFIGGWISSRFLDRPIASGWVCSQTCGWSSVAPPSATQVA